MKGFFLFKIFWEKLVFIINKIIMSKLISVSSEERQRILEMHNPSKRTIKEDVSSFESLKAYIPQITLKILKDCLTANTVVLSTLPFDLLKQNAPLLKQAAAKVDNGTANDKDVRDVAFGLIGLTGLLMGEPSGQKLNAVMVCLKDKMMSQLQTDVDSAKAKFGL